MLNRRQVLGAAGAGTLVLGAAGWWRVSRTPEAARAPWSFDPAPLADIRLDAFRYAILAPNPHNRQPWQIRFDGGDAALLACDLDRRLPETDPFDRQLTIGFGTFLELARIAAAERGHALDVTLFPQGEPQPRLDGRPIARLVFRPDPQAARDPLFAAITARRTTREAYEDRAPAPGPLLRVARAANAQTLADPQALAALRDLVVAAITTEMRTPRTAMESVRLMRIGQAEIDAAPDGISLAGPLMEALSATGQISRDALADPDSSASRSGLDMLRETYGSIPALLWITTPDNTRADQIDAGRRYVRANLTAAALGLKMHPASQSLQEYPEVAPAFARVHALLGAAPPARVQMLARIGHGPATPPSPRWPLASHLVT